MKKRLIMILALCAAAGIILTACSQSTSEPAKEETTVEETTSAEETAEDVKKETSEDTKEEAADAAEDVKTAAEDKAEVIAEEASSVSDFITSLKESDLQDIFNLIADTMDSFADEGKPSQAGNIVRSLGNLVNTIITGEETDSESSELVMDLIMDEDSLSQLSDGMILDMYEASRDELIGRGVIK